MDTVELITNISVKDTDLNEFARMAINDNRIRELIIKHMMSNPDMMVYYNCYQAVSKASKERPDLFFPYWNDMVLLLRHENSYRRKFALTILANLVQVDKDDLFSDIFYDYICHINDAKFMTGDCCVRNCKKIIKYKKKHAGKIINILLNIDSYCDYTSKQKALLKSSVLTVLDECIDISRADDEIKTFIKNSVNSSSPKTRRKAKEMVRKHNLLN
ncbi:MAG: hypothetical protein JXA42_14255 [Anaerolineales bacterium]|nr:hypothetical protein [Anaerolineales bacterium]